MRTVMKYRSCLLIVFFSFILFSCSKEDQDDVFDKDEWCRHLDITSDLIIFIPDIQIYTYEEDKTRFLNTIINRILELNDNGFKVKAVVQSGDITNHNTLQEWETAKRIFSKLDSKIPYILCAGNHDFGYFGHCDSRATYYNDYFSCTDASFVASFEEGRFENSFFRVSIHGEPFDIYSLGFAPPDGVLAWADSIAKANESETALVLTHAYLYKNGQRFDFSKYGNTQGNTPYNYDLSNTEKVNDGEEIWQKLICPNKSIKFVLCGHMAYPDYVGNLISVNSFDNSCLQLLFDTQSFPNGGDGWIQILEFKSDMKSVNILTYSAVSDNWMTGNDLGFRFIYN